MLVVLCTLALLVGAHAGRPDGDSGFFLKAPKSVPRAGRSAPGQYDGFFLKASKSVPRVGRRDGNMLNIPRDIYQQPSSRYLLNPDESIEDMYIERNYPEYVPDAERDLPRRTRRYNMASFLNDRLKEQENVSPYSNDFSKDKNDDSLYLTEI